jgi:hypothetical protein
MAYLSNSTTRTEPGVLGCDHCQNLERHRYGYLEDFGYASVDL